MGDTVDENEGKMLSGNQFSVTIKQVAAFKKLRKHLGCLLCGRQFAVGDIGRFVFSNYKDSPFKYGNFFVCDGCDRGNCAPEDNPPLLREAARIADEMKRRQELVNRLCNDRRDN